MLTKKLFLLLGATAFAISATACSDAGSSASAPAAPTVSQASVDKDASSATKYKAIASGTFDGRSDHITTGKVTVEKTASGYQLVFADNFSLDGAPDPVVAYGNNETFTLPNKLGALKHKTGAQTYALPANFKPGEFSEVYVYCEKFSVQLGVAKLSGS